MDALLEQLAQALEAGLARGCIYDLLCVGLAVIFGIRRVINFAEADLMTLACIWRRSWPRCWPGRCCSAPGHLLNGFLISRPTGLQAAATILACND